MTIDSVTPFASWDITDRTEDRALDQTLWEMMCTKSKILDAIPDKGTIPEPRFEWIYRQPNTQTVTCSGTASTDIDGDADATTLVVSAINGVQVGSILRNKSRATPIGTYQVNETMQVTGVSSTTLTLQRNYNEPYGSTANEGSTAHVAGDVYEVLYTPRQEGSSAGTNMWKATAIAENYTTTMDFYLTATGTQLARKMLLQGDQMAMQWEDRMIEMKNQISSALLYGALNPNATYVEGYDAYIRDMKGLFHWLTASGANVDYTTTTLSEEALNASFKSVMDDGGDPSDPYIILCNPARAQSISAFGADKVRTTWSEKRVGRQITEFVSDLGFVAEVIADPNVYSTDLAIVNKRKWGRHAFRPFFKKEWVDGADASYVRCLTEFTMSVVDNTTAHACFTKLSA